MQTSVFIDWAIRVVLIGFVLAIAGWLLRNWLQEKTAIRRPLDQPVSFGTLIDHCKTQKSLLEKEMKEDVRHLREVVEKDLKYGNKRFDALEKQLEAQREILGDLRTSIALLTEEVKKKNGA